MATDVAADHVTTGASEGSWIDLDGTLHQKVRLAIVSSLIEVGECDFKFLKERLALSDGNLSTHLTVLEARGYATITKQFRGKRPHTTVSITELGREAFEAYLVVLEGVVRRARVRAGGRS